MSLTLSWHQFLLKQGRTFRSNLTKADISQIVTARNYFHATSLAPCVLYYLKTSETNTKFPATISFTIRKGVPRYAQHILWVAGWSHMYAVFKRCARGRFSRLFVAQMVLTGVITTMICRLGQGRLSDKIHFVGAAMYMIDHHILFYYLNTRPLYRGLFYGSFLLMSLAMAKKTLLEQAHNLSSEGECTNQDREKQLARVDKSVRQRLWWLELWVMLFENSLFASFVSGMTSRLV